jgi:hypothetical protein
LRLEDASMSREITKSMPLKRPRRRLHQDLRQHRGLAQIHALVQQRRNADPQRCRLLVEFSYSDAFQPCLTENITRLGFAPNEGDVQMA